MRKTPNLKAEEFRERTGDMATRRENREQRSILCVPVGKVRLCVVVSDGGGWDHVSVSCESRCPTWEEMCAVKNLFFRDDEAVIQFHPKKADYINMHPYCLHLWRAQDAEFPTPPSYMVGFNWEAKP